MPSNKMQYSFNPSITETSMGNSCTPLICDATARSLSSRRLMKKRNMIKGTTKTVAKETGVFPSDEIIAASADLTNSYFFNSRRLGTYNHTLYRSMCWWMTMLGYFEQWCKLKAQKSTCKRLAEKYSFSNCQTAYFTGTEVTDWLSWYISEYPYKKTSSGRPIERESIAALAATLFKQNEFVEVNYKKSAWWAVPYYIGKLNTTTPKDKESKKEFSDSAYRVYYRLC